MEKWQQFFYRPAEPKRCVMRSFINLTYEINGLDVTPIDRFTRCGMSYLTDILL